MAHNVTRAFFNSAMGWLMWGCPSDMFRHGVKYFELGPMKVQFAFEFVGKLVPFNDFW